MNLRYVTTVYTILHTGRMWLEGIIERGKQHTLPVCAMDDAPPWMIASNTNSTNAPSHVLSNPARRHSHRRLRQHYYHRKRRVRYPHGGAGLRGRAGDTSLPRRPHT